ncbi:hypothetical protein MN116_001177, partial [Schistosoma mekongi]
NFVICDVDENDFVVFEDDGNEVVIVGCHEVGDGDDGDDEMLGEDMMNVTDEVMIDGVDVICAEHCDVEYFGCVDAIDCNELQKQQVPHATSITSIVSALISLNPSQSNDVIENISMTDLKVETERSI